MRLSIGVACMNERPKITEFLDSVTHQTVKPEVVIVDGGSSDGTLDVIKSYQKKHKNIRLFAETGAAKSPANARNIAFMKSTGQAFTLMDIDETISPNYTAAVVKAFQRNPKADQVCLHSTMTAPKPGWNLMRTVSFYRDNRKKIAAIRSRKPMSGDGAYSKAFLKKHYPLFDPGLGFGEDRVMGRDFRPKMAEENIGIWRFRTSSLTSFSQLANRYRWYGRTIPLYLNKSKNIKVAVPYALAVMSPFALPLLVMPLARGVYFTARWFPIHWNWKVLFEPFVEAAAWLFMSYGFFQYVFGKRKVGRG